MELIAQAARIGELLQSRGLKIAAAESCTGGWVAQVFTSVAGSSEWFERGFVTYSNEAKQEMLGVSGDTLIQYGAVSEQTVVAMVQGALANSHADLALAVSGIAGPGGGSPQKPVGMVCFAWGMAGQTPVSKTFQFDGERQQVREQAVAEVLRGVITLLERKEG